MMKSLTAMQLLKIFIFFRLYKLVILMIKIKIICEGIFFVPQLQPGGYFGGQFVHDWFTRK